jgi:hypothetical protein
MKLKKVILLIGLPVLAIVLIAGAVIGRYMYLLQGQAPNRERLLETASGGAPHYDPIQYRAKDARPAITEPEFVSAGEARVAAGTMGIGVSINGDDRFYPLYVLQYHQIVNDTCGGKEVACSY